MSDLLTPEEIEAWALPVDEPSGQGILAATLHAYAEVVEAIAEMDPFMEAGDGATYCFVCSSPSSFGAIRHRKSCLYMRARELRGKA